MPSPVSLSSSVFTVEELHRLSQAASGPNGSLEVLNEAQKLNDIEFEGVARSFPLRPGLSMIYTELTAKQTFEMDGEIGASLNIAVMSGPGVMEIEFASGGRHRVAANQAVLIAVKDKAMLYGKYQAGQNNRAVRLRLFAEHLEDEELADIVRAYCRRSQVLRFPYFAETSSMLPLIRDPIGGSLAGRLAAESIAFDLIARIVLSSEAGAANKNRAVVAADRKKLLRVRDLIVADPSCNYRLDELASVAGMGVSALKDKFPLLFGQPVITFLRDVRLDRAREAIECGELTVTEASKRAGYSHVSTFSTAFRKRFGAAPSAFQKKPPIA